MRIPRQPGPLDLDYGFIKVNIVSNGRTRPNMSRREPLLLYIYTDLGFSGATTLSGSLDIKGPKESKAVCYFLLN